MRKLFFSSFLFFVGQYIYANDNLSCPESLELKPSSVPSEFELYQEDQKYLCTGLSVYVGHPKEMIQLKPDPDFQRNAKQEAFWLVCHYGKNGGSFVRPALIKKLSESYTRCSTKGKSEIKGKCLTLHCS